MKKTILLAVLFTFVLARPANSAIDPKNQIQIILFSGLGGAVLGLSTLSFYSQPQDHLRNIAVGGAIALIGAVVFTTVIAAKQSKADAMDEAAGPVDGTQKKPKKIKQEPAPVKQKEGDGSDEYDDEDSYNMYNDKPGLRIFLADFRGDTVSVDPSSIYISPNFNNRRAGIDVYGRILQYNF